MSEFNKRHARLAAAIASALFLTACGGSSGSGSGGGGSIGGNVGGNNGGGDTGGDSGSDPITVSGKAADGYLAGATVCLDIDANMTCSEDEPNAMTVEGGAFTLTIPEGVDAAAHAIVVEVSETTVDEDTGLPVGKPFVLSAPAGESSFISPLTTVVHGMLQQNPALTLEDAVTQVKLSIGASSDVSLFEDYVAAKQDSDNEAAAEYGRLHLIAQVSAKVIAESHEAIMMAAHTQGIDSTAARAALLALITNQALNEIENAASAVDAAGEDFDIDAVTVPTPDVDDLEQQIENVEAVASSTKASIQTILEQGVYWMWADAENDEYEYGFMEAANTAGRLQESWFLYDEGAWVEGDPEEEAPFFLGADGWKQISDTAVNFAATYQADGSAILDLDEVDFSLKFSASEVDVSGKPIKDYLGYDGHEAFSASIAADPVFSTGAKIYKVNFIVLDDAYQLDYWTGCASEHADSSGDCNVVWGYASGHPAQNFGELIYPAGQPVSGNWFEAGDGLSIRIVADGVVHITDQQAPVEQQISFGSWAYRTVHGEQIMVLTLPERFQPRLWDEGQVILAVRDGHVRRGTFIAAGTPEELGQVQFNATAFQDLQDNSDLL